MNTTPLDLGTIDRITRGAEADRLAQAVYDRLLATLETLTPDDWRRRTECPAWTVHEMVAHMLGAAKGHASPIEFMRQSLHARRHKGAFDGSEMDAMNAYQVAKHAHLSPAELIAGLRAVAPRAVRGRRRTPGLLRRASIPLPTVGSVAPGTPTSLGLGELLDVVLTRDVWLHRIDILRATDRPVDVDSDVDRRIVADIAAEWAARHGQAVELRLTGPAGGNFLQAHDGPTIERDAVEFARILSGRADGDGLLATRVVF